MKKIAAFTFAIMLIIPFGCKKGVDTGNEVTIAKKYAKYKVAVYKEKELKTWLATLEKAEDVSLLDEEKYTDTKGKVFEISKVKLADDAIGYIESRHLADTPVVFIEDTKAFVRPTTGSSIFAVIPKGELGFIIGEKGLWVQIYAGEINKKNITQQWVESGYSKDPKTVLEAKEYTAAVNALKDTDPEKVSHARTVLENLSNGNSVIAGLAKEKIGTDKVEKQNQEEPEGYDENAEGGN